MNLAARVSSLEKFRRKVGAGPCSRCGSKPGRDDKPSLVEGACRALYQRAEDEEHDPSNPLDAFLAELSDSQREVLTRAALLEASCPKCKRVGGSGWESAADAFRSEFERREALTPAEREQEQLERVARLRERLEAA